MGELVEASKDHRMQGRTQDFKTGVTIWEGWRKRRFISGRWGKGLNKKAPMMPSLNNCNNNDARVYESKLGELVEASKDIGSCFFNGNVQGIQKKTSQGVRSKIGGIG